MPENNQRNSNSIKNWADDDKPREKMLMKGRHALSDAELIAILLRSGNINESAVSLAQKILNEAENDLTALAQFSVEKLMKFPGVGKAKALSLVAALELGRRKTEASVKKKKTITSSKDVFDYMQSVLADLPHEEFWALFLNTKNNILSRVLIGEGGTTQTLVDQKKIFRLAMEHNAVSIIVCHNHPSGTVDPSNADIQLTKKIRDGAKLLDMTLLDHVIIGQQKYYSFADEGILQQ